MKKINKTIASILAVVILIPTLALGATMKVGEEISIQKGTPLQDNLYLAGATVSVNENVSGDIIAAGGQVIFSQDVADDILIVGGSATIIGNTGGDVRVIGGNVLITGNVGGDLIITGGSVMVSSDVSVQKDLVVAGGQISVDGTVKGDTQIAGGVVTVNGQLLGNLTAIIDEKLTIGNGATIKGILEYTASNAEVLHINEGSLLANEAVFKESGVTTTTITEEGIKGFIFAVVGVFVLFKLLTLIIVSLILVWLFKKFSNSVTKKAILNPLQMLGKGFITLIILPIASILLFITLFGAPLGFVTMLSYGLLLVISSIYAPIIFGAWVSKVVRKDDNIIVTWKNVILGILLLALATMIPFIGWIIGLIVFLITLGSIVDTTHKKLWKER